MEQLPLIPRPWPERLRDARTKLLPSLVFLCTVLIIAGIWRAHFIPSMVAADAESAPAIGQGMAVRGEAEPKLEEHPEEDESFAVLGNASGGLVENRPGRASRN